MSDSNDDQRRLLELEREQWFRRCRQDFTAFSVEALSARSEAPARHHRLICEALQDVADGRCKRLLILAPPGSAKTTYASRMFPAWYFAHRPRSSIIACSHTQSLSETNSSFVQRVIRENQECLGYKLQNDARERWYSDNACAYLAGSVGSAILGFRANIAIIDDPVRSRADAESETQRESLYDWFVNDLTTRLTPDGAIVVIMTAFHLDDLSGRLQRLQEGQWRVLRLPAICDDEATDPLGRNLGEPLWADDQYGYGQRLLEIQRSAEKEGRLADFTSMYQGTPVQRSGNFFRPEKMPILELVMTPIAFETVRAWDLAASTSIRGDYTVGLKLARCQGIGFEDQFIILDIVRFRGGPDEVRSTIKTVAEADGYGTKIWLPRDPGSAGVDQADSLIRMLSGYTVDSERMSGDKATRAGAAASQANIGRLSLIRAPWNSPFLEEAAAFPRGVHDDQVDALSLAFSKLEQTNLSIWLKL